VLSCFAFLQVLHCFADWDLALAVNVKGYAFGIKHASKAMIKQRQEAGNNRRPDSEILADLGHAIVNVSSISAFMAQPGFVPYSSTKAAVNEMTRCCALDLGKHSIRYLSLMFCHRNNLKSISVYKVQLLIAFCACQPYFKLSDFRETCNLLPHATSYNMPGNTTMTWLYTPMAWTSEDAGLP